MIDFTQYKLLNNPFRISPAINADELVWAGMKTLQKNINDRIEICVKTSPSRIVLNWGSYGSGKTHAANFYTKTKYIQDSLSVKTKNLKVNLPRGTKEPVQAFLRALVGQLDFNTILEDFKIFKQEYKEDAENIIDSCTQDSIIAQALKLFFGTKPQAVQSDLFGNQVAAPLNISAMRNFLYGDSSKAVLKELNLPLGLDDDEQIVNLISGIFNVISFDKKIYKSIFLWIDEFEDIDTLPKTSQDRFTTFLRQLLDKSPNNLTIFLNLTLKGNSEHEDLSILLGEALASRTKLFIDFETPTIPEAEEYIAVLLNHSKFRQPENIDEQNLYYPFTKDSVDYLLEHIDRLTARKINETFSLVLELALILQQIPQNLDVNFIDSVKTEIPSWKE